MANIVEPSAAVLQGNRPPQEAELPHLLDDILWKTLVHIIVSCHWDDIFLSKFPRRLPHGMLLIVEIEVHAQPSARYWRSKIPGARSYHGAQSANVSSAHFKYAASLTGKSTGWSLACERSSSSRAWRRAARAARASVARNVSGSTWWEHEHVIR